MSAISNQPISHLPIVHPAKAKGMIQLCGMNTEQFDKKFYLALCVNALTIPLFSALIFSICAGNPYPRETAITACAGQGIGIGPLLILLRLAANRRKNSEPPETSKFIVDKLHGSIILTQSINCLVGTIAGVFICANQCGIGDALGGDYVSPGSLIVIANAFYLGTAVLSGGLKTV